VESLSGRRIKEGELIYNANGVLAATCCATWREAIQMRLAARCAAMRACSTALRRQAIEPLKGKARRGAGLRRRDRGRISSPNMIAGKRLLTVYGTGFNFIADE